MREEKKWALALSIVAAIVSIVVGVITIVDKSKEKKKLSEK